MGITCLIFLMSDYSENLPRIKRPQIIFQQKTENSSVDPKKRFFKQHQHRPMGGQVKMNEFLLILKAVIRANFRIFIEIADFRRIIVLS